MVYILLQNQEWVASIYWITKPLNQYPKIKVWTSDEIQPSENYEKRTVVFDHMLLSKQAGNIYLFFTRERHKNIDNYYISQSYFHLPKTALRINSI